MLTMWPILPNIQNDSKLLSGFPWPIIFKPEITKLLTEYEGVTQKVLFGNAVLTTLMSGRKYDVIPQIGDVTELSMEKIHLQIMLSNVG
jgi:hypothetical protein